MVRLFKKRFKGVAILEAAMTLPIILNILFFALEFIRVELAQIAVDSITKECTFSLMADGNALRFNEIFEKYRPWGIPKGHFRFYIRMYNDFHTDANTGLMDAEPYGGETICWAGNDWANPSDVAPQTQASTVSYGLEFYSNPAIYNKFQTRIGNLTGEIGYQLRKKLLDGETVEGESSSGKIFVLTVAVKFPFSSSFVSKLFNGGLNTNRPGVYIVWARGSGVINEKE